MSVAAYVVEEHEDYPWAIVPFIGKVMKEVIGGMST